MKLYYVVCLDGNSGNRERARRKSRPPFVSEYEARRRKGLRALCEKGRGAATALLLSVQRHPRTVRLSKATSFCTQQ
jgi:hypothetical protein